MSPGSVGDVTIRAVSPADADLLWTWANDAEARRWSFQAESIPWETHVAWLDARLADASTRLFIVGAGETPKAVVRFESGEDDAVAFVSIVVDPQARGRGWGTRALELACPVAARELGLKRVDALIKHENHASVVAFERAGFVRLDKSGRPDALTMVWYLEASPDDSAGQDVTSLPSCGT